MAVESLIVPSSVTTVTSSVTRLQQLTQSLHLYRK